MSEKSPFEKKMFENDLRPEPTLKDQVLGHLPIALLVLGVLVAFVAMHTVMTGLVVAGLAHAAIGLVLFAIRRHRGTTGTEVQR